MKKIISLMLSLVMLLSLCVTVTAAEDFDSAKPFSLGASASGSIVGGNNKEIYKFELATAANVSVNLTASIFRLNMSMFDKNGKEIWTDKQTANETTKEIDYKAEFALCKGVYYFAVSKNSGEGDFTLTISATAINESFEEEQGGTNNLPKTANKIALGQSYTGCIAVNDDTDTYVFEMAASGKLNINLSSKMPKLKIKLCDEGGKEAWSDRPIATDGGAIEYQNEIYINKGKYCFVVSKNEGEGDFTFDIAYTPVDETFAEPHGGSNNDTDTASIVNINQKYNGIIATNDTADFYEVEIADGKVTFNVSSKIERLQLKLHDKAGKVIWWDKSDWNSETKQNEFSIEKKLEGGKYFFSIEQGTGSGEYVFYVSDGGVISEAAASGSVITVRVNGKNVAFDQPPILEDGRTLVPLRAIFEALGADVNWDPNTQTVSAEKGAIKISLQIGSNQLMVNGSAKELDVPAKIVGGRTLVPVRAISEAFECAVNWEQNTKTVIINNN